MFKDAGDTGGESTGPMSTGMIFVQEDQSNLFDKFSPKVCYSRKWYRDSPKWIPYLQN